MSARGGHFGGLPSGEGKLGPIDVDFHQKRERGHDTPALRALEGISPRDLSNEQQLDRLALRSTAQGM